MKHFGDITKLSGYTLPVVDIITGGSPCQDLSVAGKRALPFWAWMARRICAQYERPMTMGSLFDGIGGFPLVFERAGAKAVWASEIEEFCVAVTKKHFPEEVTNESN